MKPLDKKLTNFELLMENTLLKALAEQVFSMIKVSTDEVLKARVLALAMKVKQSRSPFDSNLIPPHPSNSDHPTANEQ